MSHQNQHYKQKRREAIHQELQEKKDRELAELTFKPRINKKSEKSAERSFSRSEAGFLEREQMFLERKEAKLAEKQYNKLKAESS